MLIPILCDLRDAQILVKGTITVPKQKHRKTQIMQKKVIFKDKAPLTD